jgi:hypothetical protein
MHEIVSNVKLLISLALMIIIFALIILCSRKSIIESFVGKKGAYSLNKSKYPFETKNTLKFSVPKEKNEDTNKLFCYQFPNDPKCTHFDKPINTEIIDGSSKFPSVDGVSTEFKSLNMFAFNEKKHSCCGQSPYFGSGGCYCITNNQKKFLNNNGGKVRDFKTNIAG